MRTRLIRLSSTAAMVIAVTAMAYPAATPEVDSTHGHAAHAKAAADILASSNPKTTKQANVHVDAAWVRAAPPGAMMMAAYMRLHNDGKTPLTFVSARSNAFGMIKLHKTQIENGVSSMRPAGDQIIAAGGSLTLEPGSYHLMLMHPKEALKVGDKVTFRLNFADETSSDVVLPVSAQAPVSTR